MDLEALRAEWAERDRALDAALRLNRALLDGRRLDRARGALQWHVLGLWIETILACVPVVWLGNYLWERHAHLQFVLPAAFLDLGAVAILGDLIRQIMVARQLAYDQPVVIAQRRLEVLRMMGIRHLQGVLLLGALAWIPMLVVGCDAWFGFDAWRVFDRRWLVANLVFGLAVIPIAIAVSRRFAHRFAGSAVFQRVMGDLAGHHLAAARSFLSEVSAFEQPPR